MKSFEIFMNEVDLLENQAIEAAIDNNWQEALKINQKIIKIDKKNIPALLRLAFTCLQLKNYQQAKKYYQAVLKLQPNNLLAKENLEKIKILINKKNKSKNNYSINLNPDIFLETPGKTKIVKLINLGQKNLIAELLVGQEVFLKIKKRKVEVRTANKEYVGSLPDDLSKRLRLFIKAGSQYQAFIKENSLNQIVVFIKEIKKGNRVSHFVSFPEDLSSNINKITNKFDINEENENINEETSEDELIDLDEETDLEILAQTLDDDDKIDPFFKDTNITEDDEDE